VEKLFAFKKKSRGAAKRKGQGKAWMPRNENQKKNQRLKNAAKPTGRSVPIHANTPCLSGRKRKNTGSPSKQMRRTRLVNLRVYTRGRGNIENRESHLKTRHGERGNVTGGGREKEFSSPEGWYRKIPHSQKFSRRGTLKREIFGKLEEDTSVPVETNGRTERKPRKSFRERRGLSVGLPLNEKEKNAISDRLEKEELLKREVEEVSGVEPVRTPGAPSGGRALKWPLPLG